MRLFNRNIKVLAWQPEGRVPRVSVGTATAGAGLYATDEIAGTAQQTPDNGIVITEHQMKFKIDKTLQRSPNTCELTITNLAPTTRSFFQAADVTVELQVGYDGELLTLFKGGVRWCRSTHEGTEYTTTMQLGDGERNYSLSRVNRSYKEHTPVLTVLKDVAQSMGLKLPTEVVVDSDLSNQFATGAVLSGKSRDELSRLLKPYGYEWSIQDGVLVVLKDVHVTNKNDPWPVGEAHGMIGSPAFGPPSAIRILKSGKTGKVKPPSMTVSNQLYPQINPGGSIRLTSRDTNKGDFKVKQVRHEGDTHGKTWKTDIETVSL